MTEISEIGQQQSNVPSRFNMAGLFRISPSQYLPDMVCILLIIVVAYLFAGKPVFDLKSSQPLHSKSVQGTPAAEAINKEKVPGVFKQPVHGHKELLVRNIFTSSGAYTDSDSKPIPEISYTLTGILGGKETKAVFRDYSGSVVTMTVGKKMIDGFVITKIDNTSVKLKRGKEEKVLRTFDVLDPEKTTTKTTADGFVIIIHTDGSPAKPKAEGSGRR